MVIILRIAGALTLILILLAQPISANDQDSKNKGLNTSLNSIIHKKADIVFVLDTSGSMGDRITDMLSISRDFAKELKDLEIDYNLGLVTFRDFPNACSNNGTKTVCGNPGDYPYKIYGQESLANESSSFTSWLNELQADGGSDEPESILAAIRHALVDLIWRDKVDKIIILITDAYPHPDDDCCNAEGDTLDGTISNLASRGVKTYVVGPDKASLRKIADKTGGRFYKLEPGLTLEPVLQDILGSVHYGLQIQLETSCENKRFDVKARLAGQDNTLISGITDQSEVWMRINQVNNISSWHELKYDEGTGAFIAGVENLCGPINLSVFGRVGNWSSAETGKIDCGPCSSETQERWSLSGSVYEDQNSDGVRGLAERGLEGWNVRLRKPDGQIVSEVTKKSGIYSFDNLHPGTYRIKVDVAEPWNATEPTSGSREVNLSGISYSSIDFGFRAAQSRERAVSATIPPEEWNRSFGGDYLDGIGSVQQTNDSGYIIAGWRGSEPVGLDNRDIWLIKTDTKGYEVWNKTFGESDQNEYAQSVQQTSDGGYIIVGNQMVGSGLGDVLLIKTDINGTELWNKTFGKPILIDSCPSIQQTADGGYIMTGMTIPGSGIYSPDVWLVKTDINGTKLWDRTFGQAAKNVDVDSGWNITEGDQGRFVQQTTDGGYIIAGNTDSFGASGSDVWLIKTDPQGNETWNKTFGGPRNDIAYSVQQTNDDEYIIGGWTESLGAGGRDVWLIKTDSGGNELWNSTFGGSGLDESRSVQQTDDGGYIIAGYTEGGVWLIRTDDMGNHLWDKIFVDGSDYEQEGGTIHQTNDGGYIIGMNKYSSDTGGDIWLIKVAR